MMADVNQKPLPKGSRPAPPPHLTVTQKSGSPIVNKPGSTTPPPPTIASQPNTAADLLNQTLRDWGLTSLLPYVKDYLTKGYDSTTINLYLQDTPEWKQRFAGNEIRKQKGLPVLSPAQYIATEEQYTNVLQSYGLPKGFYDNHSDFTNFIGNDVSPSEVSQRAKVAHDQYLNAPPEVKQLWNQYFGPGDAIAGILDPKLGTQTVLDRAAQVDIGGAAASQGIAVSGARAAQLQQHGTTLAQAQAAYSTIAQYHMANQDIGNRFHVGTDSTGAAYGSTTNEENQMLLQDGRAQDQATVANASEKGLFQQHAGANAQSLGTSQELSATDF